MDEQPVPGAVGARHPVEAHEVSELERLLARIVVAGRPRRIAHSHLPAGSPSLPHPPASPLQMRAVMELHEQESMTVGQLAEALGVSLGWSSRVIDELVAGGLVVRERDTNDRRVVHVRLSPMARAIGARMRQLFSAVWSSALGNVEPKSRPALIRFLGQIAGELESLEQRQDAVLEAVAAEFAMDLELTVD